MVALSSAFEGAQEGQLLKRHHSLPAVRAPSANQQDVKARQWGTHLPQQRLQIPLPHLSTSFRGTVFFSSRAIRMCSGVMVFMPDRLDSCTDATAGLKFIFKFCQATLKDMTESTEGVLSVQSTALFLRTLGQVRHHMPLQAWSSRQLTHHLRMLQHCLGLIAEGQVSVWL